MQTGVLRACFLAFVLACESPTAPAARPGWVLRPSILLHNGVPAFLFAPVTVARDSLFGVGFTTFGPGCDEQGGTEVVVTGMTIEIVPMDWTPTTARTGACPATVIQVFSRAVSVRFREAGEGVVRVMGRREPGDDRVTFIARVTVR